MAADTKDLATKLTPASADLQALIAKVDAAARDVQTAGTDLEDIGGATRKFSRLAGVGQGLQALGGVLVGIGKALVAGSQAVTSNGSAIASDLQEADKLLGRVSSTVSKGRLHGDEAAGRKRRRRDRRGDRQGVGRVHQPESGSTTYAHKAQAADHKANQAESTLAGHGDDLAAADKLSALAGVAGGDAAGAAKTDA